jgi:hypothetical protein
MAASEIACALARSVDGAIRFVWCTDRGDGYQVNRCSFIPDCSLDSVLSNSVPSCTIEWQATLREIGRMLRPRDVADYCW